MAEGNLLFFGNVLYNNQGPGLFIHPQNGELRRIRVFQNTVLTSNDGIFVSSDTNPGFLQLVRGNAVFAAGTAVSAVSQSDNVTDTLTNADRYVVNPSGVVSGVSNRMDLFPLVGALSGVAIDISPIAGLVDSDRDFNDISRDATYRGADTGQGNNPGWQLALEIMPQGPSDVVFANGFEE